MPSAPRKARNMLGCIKKRFSKVSDKTLKQVDESNVVHNLKRALQSTPDLLKLKADPHSTPWTVSLPRGFPTRFDRPESKTVTPALSAHDLARDNALLSNILEMNTFPQVPTGSLTCLRKSYSNEETNAATTTKVLYSPSKESMNAGCGNKLKLKLALKTNKLLSEHQTEKLTPSIPMITLTTPHDEQTYILHRPIPPISSHEFLAVPTRVTISSPRAASGKRWPHPAGPWLRPTNSEETELQMESYPNRLDGLRLGTGRVIGWDLEAIEALGICLPPQLPTEEELQTRALVEQISKNLDQAQDALYGNFEDAWDEEMHEDECEFKMMDGSWEMPSLTELSSGILEQI